jgi:hypothetical protein
LLAADDVDRLLDALQQFRPAETPGKWLDQPRP